MPIIKIEFVRNNRFDIHLVRGQSGQSTKDLSDLLRVETATTFEPYTEYLAANANTELFFRPGFKATDDPAQAEFQNFGIHVNKKTGKVHVDGGAAPVHSPASFIVEVELTKDSGVAVADPKPKAFLQVHVHQSVTRVWLTPKRLTVRGAPGAEPDDLEQAFTVRAEFDDGTVGDVTFSDQLTFTPSARMKGPRIRVPASVVPPTVLPVTVTASAHWNNQTFDGEVEYLPTWDKEPNPPTADLVDGHPDVWSGILRPEGVPNTVFISCGFPQQADFETVTNSIVHQAKTHPMVQPYGYLKTSMNFWRVPMPSTDAGISIRFEVTTRVRDGRLGAEALPSPLPAPVEPLQWTTEHLIYVVGLPVPADLNLVKDKETNQTPTLDELRTRHPDNFDFEKLFDKWKDIGRPAVDYTKLGGLAETWLVLSNRTFIDEINGYPAMAIGDAPSAGTPFNSDRFSFHSLRGRPEDRIAFLQRIGATPKNGLPPVILEGPDATNKLGFLWTTEPTTRQSFNFDNRRLVTWLMNINSGRADGTIFTRLSLRMPTPTGEMKGFWAFPVQPIAGRNALALAMPPFDPKAIDDQTWQTFCHELSHGFFLGDEYIDFELPSPFTEADLDSTPNLSTAGLVVTADKSVAIDKIKWNWQRIRRASLFTAKITQPTPGEFHVFLGRARAFQFGRDMKVMIRQRKRLQIIGRDPVISKTVFTVLSVHGENIDDPNDHVRSTVVMSGDPGTPLQDFDDGGVLFQPVEAPNSVVPARPFLTLVPPAAERIMKAIGGTLGGKDCDPFGAIITTAPQAADPDNKVAAKNLPRVVGAFFGGHLYACGIVHPVGMCMMRNSSNRPDKPDEGETPPTPESLRGISALCPVCRFALVDIIDPEMHFQNDLDYDKWYPF